MKFIQYMENNFEEVKDFIRTNISSTFDIKQFTDGFLINLFKMEDMVASQAQCVVCLYDIIGRDEKDWFVLSPEKFLEKYKGEVMENNIIKSDKNTEKVDHPSYYNQGKIEVIEYIEDQKLDFCLGNAVKYISRAGKKDPSKAIEDLHKAIWYLRRKIREIEQDI